MSDHDAIETAWKIHDALNGWTGRVDSKASFALSIESAVLAGVVVLSGPDGRLGALRGSAQLFWYRAGLLLLALAVVTAVGAVIPQIRSATTRTESASNFIFFGHLRHWDPVALAGQLHEAELLPVLTRQLVAISKIAWRKHRLLQSSFACALAGSGCLLFAARLA